jgi:hypothetical protein
MSQHLDEAMSRKRTNGNPEAGPSRKRARLYEPGSEEPFKVSRSKIELFLRCQRCFYLDRRLGVKHPDGYPFTLNNAVDELLKKEFDEYRAKGERHPLCKEHKVNAIPFKHEDLEKWRNSLSQGVQYPMPGTNLIIQGGVDDVWIDQDTQELIVVDYKATSKKGEVSLDADWQKSYKRQVEIYQWLLRKNEFEVSKVAYFVYCNGRKDVDRFDGELKFKISLLPYEGDDSWIEGTVKDVYNCLRSKEIPESGAGCDHCRYVAQARQHIE